MIMIIIGIVLLAFMNLFTYRVVIDLAKEMAKMQDEMDKMQNEINKIKDHTLPTFLR